MQALTGGECRDAELLLLLLLLEDDAEMSAVSDGSLTANMETRVGYDGCMARRSQWAIASICCMVKLGLYTLPSEAQEPPANYTH